MALPRPHPLAAQSVRGQLIDSLTHAPIPDAFVTIIDQQGAERARTITNGAGEFLLAAPGPGTYRLRSKRIGFHPYVSAPLALQGTEVVSFQAMVHPIPVALATLVVEGERQCDLVSGGGVSVAALWDEIHEALAAVAWTARLPNYWYDLAHFQRELTASGRRKGADSTWRDAGYRLVPVKSAPPEELEAQGFVISAGESGEWIYRGPDADVLLSTPFVRTHCFETKQGRGETDQLVGLAFTPAKGRDLSDIAGTLWIDRKTAELRFVDYSYTHLPEDLVAPKAGGRIEFLRLPSGTWIVHNWAIRMPLAVMKQRPMGMGNAPEVVGFLETGGNAVEIKTRGGAVVYRSDSLVAALGAVAAANASMAPGATDPTPQPAGLAAAPAAMSPAAPGNAPDTILAAAAVTHARSKSHNTNLITQDDVQGSTATDAYTIVQELRPTWMRSRGTISIHDPSSGNVQVYLNGQQFGDVNRLREIIRQDIREIRFFSGGEAQLRFGTGHEGGVIDVRTGAIAPTGPIASAPPAPPPPPPPLVVPTDTATVRMTAEHRRALAHNQSVLDPVEYEGTSVTDVLSLIQQYRPNWLVTRGTTSIYNSSSGEVHVALNGTILVGDVSRLREFQVMNVRLLKFLSAGESQQRYGSGHTGGVIEVWMK